MASDFTIQANPKDIDKLKFFLSGVKNGSRTVVIRAMNRSITEAKTDMSRRTNRKVNLKVGVIKKSIKLKKLKSSDMSGNWNSTGNPVPLIEYGARQTNKGVTVAIRRKSKRKLIKHAFIITLKSGKKGVFWRTERFEGRGIWPIGTRITLPTVRPGEPYSEYRWPIRELFGPRIQDIMDDQDIMPPHLDYVGDRIDINMERQTDFLLKSS